MRALMLHLASLVVVFRLDACAGMRSSLGSSSFAPAGDTPLRGIDGADSAWSPRSDRGRIRKTARRRTSTGSGGRSNAEAGRAIGGGVLMPADPRFKSRAGDAERSVFHAPIAALHDHASRLNRPALLLHGDGHLAVVGRPLARADPPAYRLLRVQTHADPWIGWVHISVDPRRDDLIDVCRHL